ncbi:MAG TPA: glycoside hydrolase family 43 protein [Polyangiaceae bacterium]|nr:glycoside hydrolase family 43 protein [Polyangiaceae bacterium]
MRIRLGLCFAFGAAVNACGTEDGSPGSGGGAGSGSGGTAVADSGVGGTTSSGGASAASGAAGGSGDAGASDSGAPDSASACSTRISYGSSWIKGSNHPNAYDDVADKVTWDGSCVADSAGNAIAKLSNGWAPVFKGRNCIIALDYAGACPGVPAACETRITYGPAWQQAPNHPNTFDNVQGVVTWNGHCAGSGGSSIATLSNGWAPHFTGSGACDLAFRHSQCGGLYANPVVDSDCPDPGVTQDGDTYYMACTPGPAYPIRTSKDLVNWNKVGTIFTNANKPSWASGTYWAPEIHKVGTQYVAYFSAKSSSSGTFAIGAASASSPTGPFKDIGKPLVTEPSPGAIDAHYFRASNGKHYILWKVDGNAVGKNTPIKIQELAANGLSRIGSETTILTNTLAWEGPLVEGPWMVERSGTFYLFYSGNGYASAKYGVGVAKSNSPLGPFTKKGAPILSSSAQWSGPGHGAILKGPSGDWVHVYHAWVAGKVQQPPGRVVLVDRVQWVAGWPEMRGAPASRSQPLP